jgi:hypothetical protein
MIYLEISDKAGDKIIDLHGTFSIREVIDLIGDRLSGSDEEDDEEYSEESESESDEESEDSVDLESEIRNLRDRSAAMEESYELHGDLD